MTDAALKAAARARNGGRGHEAVTRKSIAEALLRVIADAGGEAPSFMVMNICDWWFLRRGPRWRYPLPERRTLASQRRAAFQRRRHWFRPIEKRARRGLYGDVS